MCNEYNKNSYSEKGQCMNVKEVRRQMSEDRRWEEEKKTYEDKRDNV